MKYLELLNKTAEENAKESNVLVAESSKLTLQSKMLDIKKEVARANQNLTVEKSSVNYNPTAIYSISNRILLLNKELEFYNKLLDEQF